VATTHNVVFDGNGDVARIQLDKDPNKLTFIGAGERGVTLAAGQHRVTFAIRGQSNSDWKVSIATADGTAIFSDKGQIPKDGLEVGTEAFTV
jgi:hypothetical protein